MRKPDERFDSDPLSGFIEMSPQSQARCRWAGFVFLLGYSTHFFFYMNLYPPRARHCPLCKCKQNSFSRHCNARLSAVKVWNIIENTACAAVVHGFSKPRTTFECIYTNTFTSKVSRGLDKPIPKPFGQDKPRLELALGWISREHRFCTIYTGCSIRVLCKPRL